MTSEAFDVAMKSHAKHSARGTLMSEPPTSCVATKKMAAKQTEH